MEASSSRPGLRSNASKSSSYWNGTGKPPSPTMSATTHASRPDFSHPPHLLITRADLRKSIGALQKLMQSAKLLRQTLLQLSNHTSAFAAALMDCSRVKGCDSQNGGLMGAGGLQFLMGDGERLLADQIYRNFEIPLLSTLDEYSRSVATRQAEYEARCAEKTGAIRRTEVENMRGGKGRKRDLQQFRKALSDLQAQVDELDYLKGVYHEEVMEAEDELWNTVAGRVGFVVKAQMELYERVSSKSTDPSIEPLMMSDPDPFESYGHQPAQEGQIFSVLSPLGLLHTPPKAPSASFARTPSMKNLPTSSAVGSGSASPTEASGVASTSDTDLIAVEGVMGFAPRTGSDADEDVGETTLAKQLGEDMVVITASSATAIDRNGTDDSVMETPTRDRIAFPSGGTPQEQGYLGELMYGSERRKVLSTIDDASEGGVENGPQENGLGETGQRRNTAAETADLLGGTPDHAGLVDDTAEASVGPTTLSDASDQDERTSDGNDDGDDLTPAAIGVDNTHRMNVQEQSAKEP